MLCRNSLPQHFLCVVGVVCFAPAQYGRSPSTYFIPQDPGKNRIANPQREGMIALLKESRTAL